jgi:cysteine desulfurase/selenocysteine lyase
MTTTTLSSDRLDVRAVRRQFPLLERQIKGKPLVYLDNAATSQKPQVVLDELLRYYSSYNANIHRGIHTLAEEATAAFEATRDAVQRWIGASSREEIIFTRGTTESINLVAWTWGRQNIGAGDEIILTGMEHHSNIVPWQVLCEEKKALLKVVPVDEQGELVQEEFERLLGPSAKLVCLSHASNALGTINPVRQMIRQAHRIGARVLLDGAQSAVHLAVDVQDLDCDFFCFSSHKIYGPTGVGVLYGKKELLQEMPVFQGGGEMIKEVSFEKTWFNDLPYKYEAGTPNIADTIAFRSALQFLERTGRTKIHAHESALLEYATRRLEEIPRLKILGKAREKVSLVSFVVDGLHPQDLGILLDNEGIAVRTGHHCAQPLMKRFGIPGTCRASFALYNTEEEIDRLVEGLRKAIKMLS